MNRSFATTPQLIAIHKLIEAHITSAGGLCTYEAGWDDERIAREVSPELNRNHVRRIRSQTFGNLRTHLPSNTLPPEFEELKKRHDELEQRFNSLLVLHEKLCSTLSVNRILDVRHLSGSGPLKAVK